MKIILEIPKEHEAGARWRAEHLYCYLKNAKKVCPQFGEWPRCFCRWTKVGLNVHGHRSELRRALKAAVKEASKDA